MLALIRVPPVADQLPDLTSEQRKSPYLIRIANVSAAHERNQGSFVGARMSLTNFHIPVAKIDSRISSEVDQIFHGAKNWK